MMSLITAMGQEEMARRLQVVGNRIGKQAAATAPPQSNQGLCADAIASMEGIGREAVDAFALESQQRAARAIREGWFDRSIIPVVSDEGTVILCEG